MGQITDFVMFSTHLTWYQPFFKLQKYALEKTKKNIGNERAFKFWAKTSLKAMKIVIKHQDRWDFNKDRLESSFIDN